MHLARIATALSIASFTSCGAASVSAPCNADGSAPYVARLTTDSEPGPANPRLNLTQWNWPRQIAVDSMGSIHVVWTQLGSTNIDIPADRPDPVDVARLPPAEIFYARSDDGGRTFGTQVSLVARAPGVDSPAIATAGSFVFVAFREVDGARVRAFVRSSSDGGHTWNVPVAISDNPDGVSVSAPALATRADGADGDVFAVWADGRPQTVAGRPVAVKEVYLSTSSDHGVTWSAARAVSSVDGFSSWTPAAAVWDRSVHVAWTDERNDTAECTLGANPCREEEYYRSSNDGGATWGPEVRLTTDPAGSPQESWAPSIAVWQQSVHVAYLDHRTGAFQVYYRRSLDSGASFEAEQQIASDTRYANAARPTIAAREGDVHLVWFGFTNFDADVYYSRSIDDGASWSSFCSLTSGADAVGAARMPHVAVAPDRRAHVIWYDTRASDTSGPRVEIYYGRP